MATHLEHGFSAMSGLSTALPRLQIGKTGTTLLSTIRSTIEGVVIIDASHRIVLVNQKAEQIFGYPASALLEQKIDVLLPTNETTSKQQHRPITLKIAGKRMQRRVKGMHANGTKLMLDAKLWHTTLQGELFIVLIIHETKHQNNRQSEEWPHLARLAEFRRRAASSHHANELEKRRFSKKLYDDIGQRLSVLKLDLDWLESSLPYQNETFPARVAQMQGLLDNVITMTKSMAAALRPPLLDDFGLLAAVEWMATTFQKKTAVMCSVERNGRTINLGDPIESAIFRVIQEALANIEKHAHARNAIISFLHTGTRLDVMIQDDGIGMAHDSESKPGCYGLIAMQERIFILGGTISIENVIPHGVAVSVSIPIDAASNLETLSLAPITHL